MPAQIELLDKRFTDARMHYKRSLEINPFQEAGVKLYYTVALIESGDMKEALVVLHALASSVWGSWTRRYYLFYPFCK